MTRFLNWFQLFALVCWGVLGITRAMMMYRRAVPVLVVDRQRTTTQLMTDSAAALCLLVWACEVVAGVWSSARFFGWPAPLDYVAIEHFAARLSGTLLVLAGLGLYGISLRHLGTSWRLGIDRTSPGPLVTEGVYSFSRHPIYVAFDLIFIGTFLVEGRIILLLVAGLMAVALHFMMLREECFLSQVYGQSYQEYQGRVGRYLSLRRNACSIRRVPGATAGKRL